jgi:hypothetical protein
MGVASARRIFLLGAVASAAAAAASGCDIVTSVGPRTCDREEEDNPPVPYRGGTVDGGIYQSSPWDKDLIWFPGGMQVRFEHGLGAMPRSWTAYLSFEPNGTQGGGSMAPAAGNQVELVEMDDEALTVRNSSCAEYYLLVTAQVTAAPAPTVEAHDS